MNFPPTKTEALITVLRDELQQYGVLLRLLETHHGTLVARQPKNVPGLSAEIEQSLSVLMELRERRQEEIQALTGESNPAFAAGQTIRLDGLLPHFPDMVAPMVRGLVEEVNRLVARVSRFARQNQSLLSKTLETVPLPLRTVRPDSLERAYASLGGI